MSKFVYLYDDNSGLIAPSHGYFTLEFAPDLDEGKIRYMYHDTSNYGSFYVRGNNPTESNSRLLCRFYTDIRVGDNIFIGYDTNYSQDEQGIKEICNSSLYRIQVASANDVLGLLRLSYEK